MTELDGPGASRAPPPSTPSQLADQLTWLPLHERTLLRETQVTIAGLMPIRARHTCLVSFFVCTVGNGCPSTTSTQFRPKMSILHS